MDDDALNSPVRFLSRWGLAQLLEEPLYQWEQHWRAGGHGISAAQDRSGTPWLAMFDRFGQRVDEIQLSPAYWSLLREGYRQGVLWRVYDDRSLLPFYLLGYVTSFFDPGLYCPYTVSLATAVALEKYGEDQLKARFLPPLLRRDGLGWQGATWMTEAAGGSDLGAAVATVARPTGEGWRLTGDKYFASNAGAELAVVAARLQGAASDVRGLALFLLPRFRRDGSLNYTIRRLKDKIATRSVPTGEVELQEAEAYLLGRAEWGIYLILESLNLSRVANSVGAVALMQRVLADAVSFASQRTAFGRRILDHPLLQHQVAQRREQLDVAWALAWKAVTLLEEVWRETPRYSERYHLARLVAHLAKYWTAEQAAQYAKWGMEVYGGVGTLAEFGMERWLREAMILAIWEGTPHRQLLDGLEVMERKGAHRLLFREVEGWAEAGELREIQAAVDQHLALSETAAREATFEPLFSRLAIFAGRCFRRQLEEKSHPASSAG